MIGHNILNPAHFQRFQGIGYFFKCRNGTNLGVYLVAIGNIIAMGTARCRFCYR